MVRHVYGNIYLKGERAISYNLSADYYAKKYQFSINIFRTNLKDKIQFSPADDEVKKFGYSYQWENVDDAYVQGVELGAKANLFRNFNAGINWTSIKVSSSTSVQTGRTRNDETVKEFPQRLQYAKDSRNISRFPAMTGDIDLDYTPWYMEFLSHKLIARTNVHRLQL